MPLALALLSEETGFGFGRLVLDMVRWRFERQRLEAEPDERVRDGVCVPGIGAAKERDR